MCRQREITLLRTFASALKGSRGFVIAQGPVVRHRYIANVTLSLPRLADRVAPGLLSMEMEISHRELLEATSV